MAFSKYVLAATALLIPDLVQSVEFPNPGNINELTQGVTPANTVQVIDPNHPYNADQNTMDFKWFVTQDFTGATVLYVYLKS